MADTIWIESSSVLRQRVLMSREWEAQTSSQAPWNSACPVPCTARTIGLQYRLLTPPAVSQPYTGLCLSTTASTKQYKLLSHSALDGCILLIFITSKCSLKTSSSCLSLIFPSLVATPALLISISLSLNQTPLNQPYFSFLAENPQ